MESGMDAARTSHIIKLSERMKIFIDIGHPAHVHYFKNFIKLMSQKGHEFFVTAREKEISHVLLDGYGIPYISRGKGSNSPVGKLLYLPKANAILLKHAIRFKPDIFLSFSSPYAAQVSSILRKPHIAFDDTEHATLGRMMYAPFTDLILSPSSFRGDLHKNQVKFDGFMELLYLAPDVFNPDQSIIEKGGIKAGEKFSFLRFVSWNANHDIGISGISLDNKRKIVRELSNFGKVLISSEDKLPEDLQPYQININPVEIHHYLHFASLFFGESATMASESAMLGTPAIYLDKVGRGYTDDLEHRFGLVYNFNISQAAQQEAIDKAIDIVKNESKRVYKEKSEKMQKEMCDMNQLLINKVNEILSAL